MIMIMIMMMMTTTTMMMTTMIILSTYMRFLKQSHLTNFKISQSGKNLTYFYAKDQTK